MHLIDIIPLFPTCLGVIGTGAALIGSALIGGASALKGSKDAKKTQDKAIQAAKDAEITPEEQAQNAAMTREQGIQNARDAYALERELNPLAPQLRDATKQGMLDYISNPNAPYREQRMPRAFDPMAEFGAQGAYTLPPNQAVEKLDQTGRNELIAQLKESFTGPEFADYSESELTKMAQAEATKQFKLGGKLDTETANQAVRSSAARAGRTGGGSLGLGRDLSARDLGLTSMALQQQRLNQLGQYGTAKDAWLAQYSGARNNFGLNSAQLKQQDLARRSALGRSINDMDFADRDYGNRVFQQNEDRNESRRQYEDARYRSDRDYATNRYEADRGDWNQRNLLRSQIFSGNRDAYTNYNNTRFGQMMDMGRFGEGIAQPMVGIDPSYYGNVATANSNLAGSAGQNAAAIGAQGANGLMQFGGQMMGNAFGGFMGGAAKAPGGWSLPKGGNPTYSNSNWSAPASPVPKGSLGMYGV